MSSMPSRLLEKPLTIAALSAAAFGGFLSPAIAQQTTGQSSNTMIAQQPRGIAAAISRWEYLQAQRGLSFSDYADFAKTYPTFPRMAILRLRAEAALENEPPSSDQLIAFFDELEPLTNSARARYALALAGQQRPEAFEVALKAWRSGTMSGPAEVYLLALHGSQLTEDDHRARMDALLWQSNAEAALRQLIRIPEADRPMAQARLALIAGETPEAAGVPTPPNALADPGYVYNLASMHREKRQTRAAIDVMAKRQTFDRLPVDAEDMIRLKLAVAKTAPARDAVQIAASVDDLFASQEDVSQGSFGLRDKYTDLMWLGGTKALWSLGDPASAAPLFYRYGAGAGTPLIRAKGFYWAGRAAQQAGKTSEAASYYEQAAAFPHYYYGQLALAALGKPMPSFAPLPAIAFTAEERAAFEQRPLVRAIRTIAANRYDWRTERRFFEALADSADNPKDMKLVDELAASTGLDELAVVAGMTAGEHGLAEFERLGFPVVTPPAGSNWTMVHAISRQESEFDRFRVSHAGARGVMQLMPGTAREQAGKLGMRYMSASLIDDPGYNIRLGDAYFARMLDYYGGAYPLAIGAYNAGPGRVNQWLRMNGDPRRGDLDWVTWVERIPANFETRYYIMRVIGNAVSYSHMYPDQAGRPLPVGHFLP
jgi:soluble lytic murein transglycosylase